MKRNLAVIAVAVVMGCAGLRGDICAQAEWPSKPVHEWSKAEAEALLSNSPWAKREEIRISFDKRSQVAAGSYSGVSAAAAARSRAEIGGGDIPVDFVFTLRLRSALPVRQALVRLKQLETNVDRLTEQEGAKFLAQIKGMLECPACTDNYVLTLSSNSTTSPGADAVFTIYKGGRLADLQRYIYIANERGERRSLVHFVPPRVPGDDATFFFPRLDENNAPLITPENKYLLINLSDNRVSTITNFKIEVSSLVVNGEVVF